MNRTQIAGIFILAAGMLIGTTAAQPQTERVQADLGDIGLSSIYAYDNQSNFASIIFTDDGDARYFGTEGGISELDPNSAQLCFQYTTTEDGGGGVFGDLFNRGGSSSEATIECQQLQMGNMTQNQTQQQIPPIMNQTQENMTENFTQNFTENFTQQNQTQQQQNETPASFYAYDDEGGYINITLDNQENIQDVTGSVADIGQLQPNSTVGCEVFQQDGNSETNCYDSQELQNRVQNGSITYLPLENQTQQNQTQNDSQQGDQGGDDFDLPFV